MNGISKRLGEIITAIAAVALLVGVALSFASPIGSFFFNAIDTIHEEGNENIWTQGSYTPGNIGGGSGGTEETVTYTMLEGAGQEYSGAGALTFRSDAPYDKFEGVTIDGVTVDSSNYTVSEGSTVITFTGDFALTIVTGTHIIEIVSKDGKATATFTVLEPELAPGLYDDNGDMIASWDELTNTYGLDVTKNYSMSTYNNDTASPYYVLTNNTDLADGTTLIIGDVTTIGSYAFSECTGLTSVEIPASVTSIEYYAFSGCTSLASIEIPDSVTSIGSAAFNGCSNLTSVTFGENSQLTTLQGFQKCTSLTSIGPVGSGASVEIPDNVTTIGCFRGCSGLTNITIPDNITSIGGQAFYDCTGLTSIEIPASVTSIGQYAFNGCTGLTSIEIPSSVTSIGIAVFSNCTNLTDIDLPDGLTAIGELMFAHCKGLTSIEIPDSVTSIGPSVFYNCQSLASIEIPDSVTTIGNYAFYNCKVLTSIEIPANVTAIGKYAFDCCSGLTSATFKNPNGWYTTTTENAASGYNVTLTNTSSNVTYLYSWYCSSYWYRK